MKLFKIFSKAPYLVDDILEVKLENDYDTTSMVCVKIYVSHFFKENEVWVFCEDGSIDVVPESRIIRILDAVPRPEKIKIFDLFRSRRTA